MAEPMSRSEIERDLHAAKWTLARRHLSDDAVKRLTERIHDCQQTTRSTPTRR